jgi:hypothetical protein
MAAGAEPAPFGFLGARGFLFGPPRPWSRPRGPGGGGRGGICWVLPSGGRRGWRGLSLLVLGLACAEFAVDDVLLVPDRGLAENLVSTPSAVVVDGFIRALPPVESLPVHGG